MYVSFSELIENYNVWQKLAVSITKNEFSSKDLVHDMYLKIHSKFQKNTRLQINDFYVYCTLKSIYSDQKRKSNLVYISSYFDCLLNEGKDNTQERKKLNQALDKLDIVEREVLLGTAEMSLREYAKELDKNGIWNSKCNHQWLFRTKRKALDKLKKIYNERI